MEQGSPRAGSPAPSIPEYPIHHGDAVMPPPPLTATSTSSAVTDNTTVGMPRPGSPPPPSTSGVVGPQRLIQGDSVSSRMLPAPPVSGVQSETPSMPPPEFLEQEQEPQELPLPPPLIITTLEASNMAVDSDAEAGPEPMQVDPDDAEASATCMWDNCGRLFTDLKSLIDHIHNDHVGVHKSTYTCEWATCGRKGVTQTSRFALISHIRSHTGEKPFLCELPECDKAFTRSDALAKHMRLQHNMDPPPPGRGSRKRKRAGGQGDDGSSSNATNTPSATPAGGRPHSTAPYGHGPGPISVSISTLRGVPMSAIMPSAEQRCASLPRTPILPDGRSALAGKPSKSDTNGNGHGNRGLSAFSTFKVEQNPGQVTFLNITGSVAALGRSGGGRSTEPTSNANVNGYPQIQTQEVPLGSNSPSPPVPSMPHQQGQMSEHTMVFEGPDDLPPSFFGPANLPAHLKPHYDPATNTVFGRRPSMVMYLCMKTKYQYALEERQRLEDELREARELLEWEMREKEGVLDELLVGAFGPQAEVVVGDVVLPPRALGREDSPVPPVVMPSLNGAMKV